MKPRVRPPKPEYLEFLKPYGPQLTQLALAIRSAVLSEAPESAELIYDAYSAVASGYSFTGRPSDAFIHIAVYSKWVNLGFNFGSRLDDPEGLLHGTGRWIRHIRISSADDLERPAIRALIAAAVLAGERPDASADKAAKGQSVVRAVYPKRRRPLR